MSGQGQNKQGLHQNIQNLEWIIEQLESEMRNTKKTYLAIQYSENL